MLLCRKIQIELTEEEKAALEFMQSKCRGFYNWWVMKLKNGAEWDLETAKKSLQDSKAYDPELQQVYGKLLAEVYFRLDRAMQAFFRRVKAGEKPGFPRYRMRHQFFTLTYPAMYIKIEGTVITLPTGGRTDTQKKYPNVRAKLTEEPPPGFREVQIVRDQRGHYACCFSYVIDDPKPRNEGVAAFDLGIRTLATGVNQDGRIYHVGGFKGYQWYNRQLDKRRSKRSHCQKGSRRYVALSKAYRKVSEAKLHKQKDCHHKASRLIADKLAESTVVIGDLSQSQMVAKSDNPKRNRAVYNDWGLRVFVQMLVYKCQKYGKTLAVQSERYSSQDCNRCGHRHKMPLRQRTYCCSNPQCQLVMGRDENSAVIQLQDFLGLPKGALAKKWGFLPG
jgi:putative transposase